MVVSFGDFKGVKDSLDISGRTTGFILEYHDGGHTGLHNHENSYGFASDRLLIVGNIYQNPELLESVQK